MKTPLIGDKHFYSDVVRIGLPIALQNLLISSGSIVDTFMIGTQGELALAAVGICSQFTMLLFSAFYGFCHGGIIFIAQYWGAKDDKGIGRAYGVMLVSMMVFGLLFGVTAITAPEWILRIYTDKENVIAAGAPYLRILGFSYPLQVIAFAVSSLLRTIEKVKMPLYASIAALVSNTFFNWVLIYGKFGFPAMGVAGAATGTLISNAVNVLVLYAYCALDKGSYALRIRDHFRWTFGFVSAFFKKSGFIVLNEAYMGVANAIINMILGRQDEAGLAALAAFRVIEGLIFAFFKGLTSASAVLVGKQVGAGNHRGGYTDAKRFALLVPLITFVICALLLPFRAQLFSFFMLSERALEYGMNMLLIYSITGTIRSLNWICNDCFRAGGDPLYGTVVEIICITLVTIPLMAFAGLRLHWSFLAVFALMFADDIVRVLVIVRHLLSGKWVKPVTREGQEALPAFFKQLSEKA